MTDPTLHLSPPMSTYGGGVIPISDKGDIIISVVSTKGPRTSTDFSVEREALLMYSGYFSATLLFNATDDHKVEIESHDVGAIRVWLAYMHAEKDRVADESRTKVNVLKMGMAAEDSNAALFSNPWVANTDIVGIWHIINAGNKYLFKASILVAFFRKWYDKNVDMSTMQPAFAKQLVFPCYLFDHPEGFAAVTKWLAYNGAGYISENRLPEFKHLDTPDFFGMMNHARASLKAVLHHGIWDKIGTLLEVGKSQCECRNWDAVAGRYFAELVRTKAYPLEDTFPKSSISTLLSNLAVFNLGRVGACDVCNTNWNYYIQLSVQRVKLHFNGLCMDCMKNSRRRHGDTNADYWKDLQRVNGRWDSKCRTRHGQHTWYMSWCGRDDHRRKLQKLAIDEDEKLAPRIWII